MKMGPTNFTDYMSVFKLNCPDNQSKDPSHPRWKGERKAGSTKVILSSDRGIHFRKKEVKSAKTVSIRYIRSVFKGTCKGIKAPYSKPCMEGPIRCDWD